MRVAACELRLMRCRSDLNPHGAANRVRRLAENSKESSPHPFAIAEPCFVGDDIQGVLTFLHHQAR
jgi:hypothetical protein